jgi:alkaline phosphatase D
MRLRILAVAGILGWSLAASKGQGASQDVTRVAFGSCARENLDQPIWDKIIEQTPDAFLMLGDTIYADTSNIQVMRSKYAQLAAKPEFQRARRAMPFFATWDDHDYGKDDGGREFSFKKQSQQAFLDFWEVPAISPLRTQDGVYNSAILGAGDRRVQIIMLDTRYFRSPLKRQFGRYVPNWDPASTMLGDAQWKWLENELKKPAEVRIIASSIQFASDQHAYESWGKMPRERQKLLDLITDTGAKGVVIISGDRHFGEVSRIPPTQKLYPIFDLTSSGLASGRDPLKEANPYRITPDVPYTGVNFGTITIIWDAMHGPQVEFKIHDGNGKAVTDTYVPLTDLRFDTIVLPAPLDRAS